MDLYILILSSCVIWIASVCKILYVSHFPSKAQHFNTGSLVGESLHKKTVLLVIAHPDDESMFFTPTINYLASRGYNIHILCLSTGNANGMGNIRRNELYNACSILKLSPKQVVIIDHPELQDGCRAWNHTIIAKIVEDNIKTHDIGLVITFDCYGISGHCNHRDVHFGIRKLLLDSQQSSFEAWELDSTNILCKYSGPADIWLSIFKAWYHTDRNLFCVVNEHPLKSFQAMAQHLSQWVWFRKLFVCFSSYTYVNTLRRIEL